MAHPLLMIHVLLSISIHGGRWLGLLDILGECSGWLQKSAADANGNVLVCSDMDGGAQLGVGFLFEHLPELLG